MTGRVTAGNTLLPVVLRTPMQGNVEVSFVIDSGFEGALTLPPADVAALGLVRTDSMVATLADGSHVRLPVYAAVILWHGVELAVAVLATGDRPLLGTSLLDENDVHIEFWEGGRIVVMPRHADEF